MTQIEKYFLASGTNMNYAKYFRKKSNCIFYIFRQAKTSGTFTQCSLLRFDLLDSTAFPIWEFFYSFVLIDASVFAVALIAISFSLFYEFYSFMFSSQNSIDTSIDQPYTIHIPFTFISFIIIIIYPIRWSILLSNWRHIYLTP